MMRQLVRKLFGRDTRRRAARPRPSAARCSRPRRSLPQIEALESRYAPAVSAFLSGGQLLVNGDGGGNIIRLDTGGFGEFVYQRVSQLAAAGFDWQVVDIF